MRHTHTRTQRQRRKGGLQTPVALSGRYSLASRERGERDGVSRPGGLLQGGAGRGAVSCSHVPIDCSERRLGAGQEAQLSFGHPRRHGRLVAGLIAAGRLLCRGLLSLRLRNTSRFSESLSVGHSWYTPLCLMYTPVTLLVHSPVSVSHSWYTPL